MKGLTRIPSLLELRSAYDKLQFRPLRVPSSQEIVQFAQWTRFDPRLGQLLVSVLQQTWQAVSPIQLKTINDEATWAAALAVILEFVEEGVPRSALETFSHWKALVLDGITPARHEQFFIALSRIGGRIMFEDAHKPLRHYQKWGYLAREVLSHQDARQRKTRISRETRLKVLKEIMTTSERITVQDYLRALGNQVHPRQAERDLREASFLSPRGRTRARFYVAKR